MKMTTKLNEIPLSRRPLDAALMLGAVLISTSISGCSSNDDTAGGRAFEHLYATASVTWTDDVNTTYVSLLPNLDKVSVSLREIVAAVAGSLIVLAAIWLYRRYAK